MATVQNEELVRKAIITAVSNLAAAGKLNPKQSDRFIDYVFDETGLTQIARTIKFTNETLEIDKIGIGNRALVPKAEAQDPGIRKGVQTSKITLTPKEVFLGVELSDIFKEINIEGPNVATHIMQLFARQVGNDLESMYIEGNTGGVMRLESFFELNGSTTDVVEDTLFSLFSGFLELALAGNVVDFAGDPVASNVFGRMLRAMPNKFKKNKAMLRWLVPHEIDELWRERVSGRGTAAGDAALAGTGNVRPFGIEMIPLSLMPGQPIKVKTDAFTGAGTSIDLDFAPIESGSVVVTEDAISGGEPIPPYVEGASDDYTVDYTNGTVSQVSGGGIGTTESVRITYQTKPQIMLTTLKNLIIGIGRDIRMERAREIFRSVDQFAVTAKVSCNVEETDAVVLGTNINDEL